MAFLGYSKMSFPWEKCADISIYKNVVETQWDEWVSQQEYTVLVHVFHSQWLFLELEACSVKPSTELFKAPHISCFEATVLPLCSCVNLLPLVITSIFIFRLFIFFVTLMDVLSGVFFLCRDFNTLYRIFFFFKYSDSYKSCNQSPKKRAHFLLILYYP